MIESQDRQLIEEDSEQLVKWLASFGQTDNGGINRLLYTPAWVEAQQALQAKMKKDGLSTYFDSVGNLFGRLEGSKIGSKTILTGSHIDSVVNGGIYDGVFGIIASLVAVQKLKQRYGNPKKTIEVVSLCEEEGSRFPLTFWGSGNITGKYTLKDAEAIVDSNGISLLEAMKDAGFDPESYHSPRRKDLECFLELHVEQGIILDKTGDTLGTVSHIVGQRRFNIRVSGESNHAGTTPMRFRKDALQMASEFISYIAEKAKKTDPDLVATVGKINANPNVPNVIAGDVLFTLDVRHYQEEVLDAYCQAVFQHFESVAKDQDFQLTINQWMEAEPVEMDSRLMKLFEQTAQSRNIPHQTLFSGAGHDAQVFGTYCPTSLLFIPSLEGISHSPREFSKKQDMDLGIDVLTEVLYKLAY
ncbi:allantoate deiminase [Sediminibacillus massiliensis]|uniref:allantoate deiminase n=1 Tax=Sediminibacillus massiliensis TaxID=1926277 RepID=UPI000988755F|nr:allantoate deiminase [Sediminibacillus massiliensis]